jgi:hypothetical protein
MKNTHSDIITDNQIAHVWVSPSTGERVELDPTFYENNGTPIVGDDEEDALYVHTEVRHLGQLLDEVAATIKLLKQVANVEGTIALERAYNKFKGC